MVRNSHLLADPQLTVLLLPSATFSIPPPSWSAQVKASFLNILIVLKESGCVIKHPEISFRQEASYRQDGVQFSESGMDLWLHGI